MRVPLSWLRALVPGLTAGADEVAAALVRVGLEVEQVVRTGDDVSGVVVGEVVDVEDLSGYKKPIRYCHVQLADRAHEVVCGATNFAPGDRVAFATPGATLPGGFSIATRRTYGRTSDGMICSAAELGLPDDGDGILVLAADAPLGADVVEVLGLRDAVLDIAVTPDRGYALSVRGVARETATAYGLPLADPGLLPSTAPPGGHPIRVEDPSGCDRFVARSVTGFDPGAPSPGWLQRRLVLAGMRPISLAVDVTNHVMLELGQPLHAYDRGRLSGDVVVRRARAGERLTTLDGRDRTLDPDDLLIADDTGAVGLAGVMGGASTEVGGGTTELLVEAAHFAPVTVARAARRHRLPSEASRRFERGVDPALPAAAAEAAVRLLVDLGGATAGPGTDVDTRSARLRLRLPLDLCSRVAGRGYPAEAVRRRLADVGCDVQGADPLDVTPPSWRPDLLRPIDLVEEVVRLEGYDTVPVQLPVAPAGRGLTREQRLRRTASRALASAGLVEVVPPPFVGEGVLRALGVPAAAPRLVNPLSEQEALLSPTLLAGLLAAVQRNVGRGLPDVALFTTGLVFGPVPDPGGPDPDPDPDQSGPAERLGSQDKPEVSAQPGVAARPDDAELAALDARLPLQPRHAAVALAGSPAGRPTDWADAVEAVRAVGRALGLDLALRAAQTMPWHPGRCAAVLLDGAVIGHAGELHPRVVEALQLPPRTCAAEVDLDALVRTAAAAGPVPAPVVSPYPPASVDVALVVDEAVPAAAVEQALRVGAGPLLEALRLFDVYTGPQVGAGRRSLAWSLRLRAPDRTLTDSEVLQARDDAVAEAGRQVGAVLRT